MHWFGFLLLAIIFASAPFFWLEEYCEKVDAREKKKAHEEEMARLNKLWYPDSK